MPARFFCDNCQSEVQRNTSRCSGCGRFFASVRCPKCSFTGEESQFTKGCPVCGYCAPKQAPAGKRKAGTKATWAGKLPIWVYILSILGLTCVALILYFTLQ